jgi:L-alanine-DL-glutamate epimerase-like enolase superfamily enzyme
MLRHDQGFELPRLLHSVRGYLARGFNGVKIKVGRPELADDVARVRAVRELLGAEVALIVDANHALSESQAIAAARAFEPLGLLWFEEPTLPNDFDAYARIAAATALPLATDENLHTRQEFEEAFARSLGMPVCSHGMQELHVSLMAAQPNAHWR